MLNWLLLNMWRVLWLLAPIRRPRWSVASGTPRISSDEKLYARARRAMALGSPKTAYRILDRHSMPIHAVRALRREFDDRALEASRTAWAQKQSEDIERRQQSPHQQSQTIEIRGPLQ